MRVLHLSDRASARGGADWHLCGVIAAQTAHHEVCLAVGRVEHEARCRVEVVAGLDAAGGAPVRAALERLRDDFAPDVVHIHNALNPEALAWAAERGAVATVQDHRSFCPGRGKLTLAGGVCRTPMGRDACAQCFTDRPYYERILALTERRLHALKRMPAITVLSAYMKGELAAAGVEPGRITVIAPFVHGLAPDQPAAGPSCVLFAGRLVEAKGVRAAIEAHHRSGVELPLVFAGSGTLRADLEAAGYEVLGWVPHAAMSEVLQRARALVMPSLWQEPFGIVGLEALSLGVPVVAWRSGGLEEWHAEPSLLCEWGDVDALALNLRRAVHLTATAPHVDEREQMDLLLDVYRALRAPRRTRSAVS